MIEQIDYAKEKYIHLCLSIEELKKVVCLLEKIAEDTDNPLALPAFQYALIMYAKPYKKSNSTHKEYRFVLDKPKVDDAMQVLHNRIIGSRDTLLAHKDLIPIEPWVCFDKQSSRTIVAQKNTDGLEGVSDINEIITLINASLDLLNEEEKYMRESFGENFMYNPINTDVNSDRARLDRFIARGLLD